MLMDGRRENKTSPKLIKLNLGFCLGHCTNLLDHFNIDAPMFGVQVFLSICLKF
jgi:hypothetical protein